jgi:hypothetical protein
MAGAAIREAVGVFRDEKSLQAAADELMISGFDRGCLSILAARRTIEKKLGHVYEQVTDLADVAEVPRLVWFGSDSRNEAKGALSGGLIYIGAVAAIGAVVASGGTVAATIAAAAAVGGAGGLVGVVLSVFLERHHAEYLGEHLNRGGILLWVQTENADHERRAIEILERHSAEDVHIHDLPKAGWGAVNQGA